MKKKEKTMIVIYKETVEGSGGKHSSREVVGDNLEHLELRFLIREVEKKMRL